MVQQISCQYVNCETVRSDFHTDDSESARGDGLSQLVGGDARVLPFVFREHLHNHQHAAHAAVVNYDFKVWAGQHLLAVVEPAYPRRRSPEEADGEFHACAVLDDLGLEKLGELWRLQLVNGCLILTVE